MYVCVVGQAGVGAFLQTLMLNRKYKEGRDGEGWDESIVGVVLITFWLLELARRFSNHRDEATQSSSP